MSIFFGKSTSYNELLKFIPHPFGSFRYLRALSQIGTLSLGLSHGVVNRMLKKFCLLSRGIHQPFFSEYSEITN